MKDIFYKNHIVMNGYIIKNKDLWPKKVSPLYCNRFFASCAWYFVELYFILWLVTLLSMTMHAYGKRYLRFLVFIHSNVCVCVCFTMYLCWWMCDGAVILVWIFSSIIIHYFISHHYFTKGFYTEVSKFMNLSHNILDKQHMF